MASVNLARLSIKKAAYVAVDESSVTGNPEFAPNDKGGSGSRFGAEPTALRSSSELIPSPPGLGSRFGDRPSGPRIHGDFCRVISFSTCHRQVGSFHGTPGQAG